MATPFFDLIQELRALGGAPKVSYPTGATAFPSTERVIKARRGSHLIAPGTAEPDATRFPNAILVEQKELSADAQYVEVYRRYDTIPGGTLTNRGVSQWGTTTTTEQAVAAGSSFSPSSATADASQTGNNVTESKNSFTNYDALPSPWLFSYQVDPETNIGTRVQKRLNVNGTRGGISATGTVSITNATVANPTVLTLSAPIPTMSGSVSAPSTANATGDIILITGDTNATTDILSSSSSSSESSSESSSSSSSSAPEEGTINGQWPITIIDSTHISIPADVVSVVGSGFGTVRLAALVFQETQELNYRQCIEIWSQIDSSTLANATKIWTGRIDYSWPEVLVAIDTFDNTETATTNLVGTFPNPTTLTYHYGFNEDTDVGIRTARYTGKTLATIKMEYFIGAPPVDASVLEIRTSSGEIVMSSYDTDTHEAISVSSAGEGLQTSVSFRYGFKTQRVENVISNGWISGNLFSSLASVDLKLDPSSPVSFTRGDTFTATSEPQPGRLGLYSRKTVIVTVPDDFPLIATP